jgi:hypothetical protein
VSFPVRQETCKNAASSLESPPSFAIDPIMKTKLQQFSVRHHSCFRFFGGVFRFTSQPTANDSQGFHTVRSPWLAVKN